MANCTGTFICLGIFFCIFGFVCFGIAAGLGDKLEVLNHAKGTAAYADSLDECDPKRRADFDGSVDKRPFAMYHNRWWISACPGVIATYDLYPVNERYTQYRYIFLPETFPSICSCKKGRLTTVVLMGLIGFTQFVIGIVFSCIGCLVPGSCCRPRKAWGIFCGFVLVFLFFSFVSFVLALYFRMNAVNEDLKPDDRYEYVTNGRNGVGIAFTAFCGIDMFLNLIAAIMACVGFCRAGKNNNQTDAVQEQIIESNDGEDQGKDQGQAEGQDQGQGQGQGSRQSKSQSRKSKNSGPDNPPAYSKSQSSTNASAKSQRSSRVSNQH